MIAARYRTSGPRQGVLAVEQIPDVAPGPGEVRVKVAVSGVNPTDWKTRQALPAAEGAFLVPNQDGAGTIDAVGPGVSPSRVGERVWVHDGGPSPGLGNRGRVRDRARGARDPSSRTVPPSTRRDPRSACDHRLVLPKRPGPVTRPSVLISGGAGAVGHAAIELRVRGRRARGRGGQRPGQRLRWRRRRRPHVVNYREHRRRQGRSVRRRPTASTASSRWRFTRTSSSTSPSRRHAG